MNENMYQEFFNLIIKNKNHLYAMMEWVDHIIKPAHAK